MRPLLALLLSLLFATTTAAASPTAAPSPAPPACACTPVPPIESHVLEVTFGSAQLFDHQDIVTKSGQLKEEIIPVTSALLMVEWLLHRRWSLLSLFNLPLGTQKTYEDGRFREEFVAPSVAVGARFAALSLEVFAASHLELQLAALGGVTIGSSSAAGDVVFPLAAGRIHFSNRNGFALYLGGAFAFQKDTLAVLYGIGHRF